MTSLRTDFRGISNQPPEVPWPALAEKLEKHAWLLKEQADAQAQHQRLRQERAVAEQTDREAFARALAEGADKEPPRAVLDVDEALAASERRIAAFGQALTDARRDLIVLFEGHREDWQQELLTRAQQSDAEYEAAIDALLQARLVRQAHYSLLRWVSAFPGEAYSVGLGAVRVRQLNSEAVGFDTILDAMRPAKPAAEPEQSMVVQGTEPEPSGVFEAKSARRR